MVCSIFQIWKDRGLLAETTYPYIFFISNLPPPLTQKPECSPEMYLNTCVQIEESAKKPVEATSSSSDVLKLYNKWYEKLEPAEDTKEKGLFQKVKKAIKDRTVS